MRTRINDIFNIINGTSVGSDWRSTQTVKARHTKAESLNRDVPDDELYIAIGKLKRRAAPGVDGLPPQAVADALEKGGDGEESINVLVPHLVVLNE